MARHTKHRRSLIQRLFGWLTPFKALLLLAVLAGAGWGAYEFGKSWYLDFREKKLVETAENNIASENFSEAALSAKRALQLNNRSVPATQSMAYLAETLETPDAILWRSRVLELSPEDPANRTALAAASIRFGEVQRARQALEELPESERNSVNFHELSALISFSEGLFEDSIYHFQSALELDPDDKSKLLNLAKAQLFSPSNAQREDAVVTLEKLAQEDEFAGEALRLLIRNAFQLGSVVKSLEYARQLEGFKDATMQDLLLATQVRLTHFNSVILPLDIQSRLNLTSSRLPVSLKRIKKLALKSPETLVQTIQWMYRNGLALQAVLWTRGELLLYQVSDPRIQAAIGECYIRLKDWDGLLEWSELSGVDWEFFEYFRHAYRAKAIVELGQADVNSDLVKGIWLEAIESSEMNPGALELLANRANNWGWEDLSVSTYWTMINNVNDPTLALQVLFRYYSTNKNTYGLWRITDLLVRRDPTDLILKNNLAQLSMLLKSQLRRATEIAAELYEAKKDQADYSSTHAFGLLLEKRYRSALQVIRQFPESSLTEPSVALYVGLVFYANDLKEDAERFFRYARAGVSNFLPEENALLDDPSLIMNWMDTPPLIDIKQLPDIDSDSIKRDDG